jgi:hypothetical protein
MINSKKLINKNLQSAIKFFSIFKLCEPDKSLWAKQTFFPSITVLLLSELRKI